MDSLYFWRTWPHEYKVIWYCTAGIFCISILSMWFFYFKGLDNVIHWEKIQEQKVIESTIHTFKAGPFELSVPAENFVIFEYFNGSNLNPYNIANYLFLVILLIAFIVLASVITTLGRFWHFAGIIMMVLFFLSLRLDVLELFHQRNYYPSIGAILLFTGCSFYFNLIKPGSSFTVRLAIFAGITLVLLLAILFFSNVPYPILHLAVTAYPAGLILTILFIILVSHEIIASFIFLISRGVTSKSLQHFLIISIIYIANLVITYLHETGSLHWNFFINLYLLLFISALVGVWGFKEREPINENILPFFPGGAFLFMALGAVAFVTIGSLLGNANDAALKVVRDSIIFSHLGYGILFTLYIFSNFVLMLAKNLPVTSVLYKPTQMPYFTFQFAGLIITLAFLFVSGWRNYVYNGFGGFYNNLADLHVTLDNDVFAQAHYNKARMYAFQDHHANYALGRLKVSRFGFNEAHNYFNLANGKKPSEFSLINAGNLYLWEGDNFKAIKAYQHGKKIYPSSEILKNNLGFAFSNVHRVDSAIHYFSEAVTNPFVKNSAEANFFALAAKEYFPVKADSILQALHSDYHSTQANALALATVLNQKFSTPLDPLHNKHLNLYSATLLNNYIIHYSKTTLDTTFIEKAYRIANDSVNDDFSETLKVTLATAYYFQQNVSKALQIMAELAFLSQSYQGRYNYLMGLWALEQNNPELAASYFDYAEVAAYKDAKLYKAIALLEDGQVKEALQEWDSLIARNQGNEAAMGLRIKEILTTDPSKVASMSDPEKYQFCRYRLNVYDTLLFNRVVATFQDHNYKAKALLDMSQRQFAWDDIIKAIRYFTQISGLQLTDAKLYEEIQHHELLMLAERRELRQLANQINTGIELGPQRRLEKIYYTALLNEASGDTINAEKNYAILSTYNPYFEEGLIAAANYYRRYHKDPLKPYTILAEAIQVNNNSIKLLNAYVREASRIEFEEYALDAQSRIDFLKDKKRQRR